jgi:hypothetical protein
MFSHIMIGSNDIARELCRILGDGVDQAAW